MKKTMQARSRKTAKDRKVKMQLGFSLLETLLSIGLLGIALVAYTRFYAATMNANAHASEVADYLMLRQFINSQFSCETTLAATTTRVNGRITEVKCPFSLLGTPVDIMSADNRVLINKFDPNGKKEKDGISVREGRQIGRYRVVGLCDGNGTVPDPGSKIQIPAFRFWASVEDDDIPFSNGVMWRARWYDVFDGNELQCSLPDDPGLPLDSKCTAMFVTDPGNTPTGQVHGSYFRSSGGFNEPRMRMPAVSLLIRSERDLDAPGQGQVTSWKMKWMNKNPIQTIGSYVPNTTFENNFVTPVASPEFTVTANMNLATLNQPLGNCTRPPTVSGTIPTLNENPGCAFWEQKISFTQMQNPTDWYAAPLELIIQGIDSKGSQITECTTKLQLVSPLVLVWPKGSDDPGLDFYPTSTKFDLTATGKRLTTGWINSESAFLVLDRNHNGKIDDGSELFGNASPIGGGKTAGNGFAALAVFDDNHDNLIDAKDRVYNDLRLWFDENTDGQSQPWELRKLTDYYVEKISLKYKEVEKQPEEASMLTRFTYESSFYGSGLCGGAEGCRIFDVYFATAFPTVSR